MRLSFPLALAGSRGVSVLGFMVTEVMPIPRMLGPVLGSVSVPRKLSPVPGSVSRASRRSRSRCRSSSISQSVRDAIMVAVGAITLSSRSVGEGLPGWGAA